MENIKKLPDNDLKNLIKKYNIYPINDINKLNRNNMLILINKFIENKKNKNVKSVNIQRRNSISNSKSNILVLAIITFLNSSSFFSGVSNIGFDLIKSERIFI